MTSWNVILFQFILCIMYRFINRWNGVAQRSGTVKNVSHMKDSINKQLNIITHLSQPFSFVLSLSLFACTEKTVIANVQIIDHYVREMFFRSTMVIPWVKMTFFVWKGSHCEYVRRILKICYTHFCSLLPMISHIFPPSLRLLALCPYPVLSVTFWSTGHPHKRRSFLLHIWSSIC